MIEGPREPANDNKEVETEPIDPTGIEGVHDDPDAPTVDELLKRLPEQAPGEEDGITPEEIYRITDRGEE